MAWFEVHQEFYRHPKLDELARLSGLTHNTCVGVVVGLWTFCADFAKDGDLTGHTTNLSNRLHVPDPLKSKIVKCLVKSGWIDDDLRVHDWKKHGLRLLDQNKTRQRKLRDKKQLEVDHVTLRSRAHNALRTIRTIQTLQDSTYIQQLDGDAFLTAWCDWWVMRSVELKRPISDAAALRLVKQLVKGKWGTDLTAVVRQSADNGWQGFWPLNGNTQQKPKGFHVVPGAFPGLEEHRT